MTVNNFVLILFNKDGVDLHTQIFKYFYIINYSSTYGFPDNVRHSMIKDR